MLVVFLQDLLGAVKIFHDCASYVSCCLPSSYFMSVHHVSSLFMGFHGCHGIVFAGKATDGGAKPSRSRGDYNLDANVSAKKKKARRFTRLWLQYSRQPQRYVFAARKCVRARVRLARGRLLLRPHWSPGSTPVWA